VRVNFRFIEIHPEAPEQGTTVDALNYSGEKWQGMIDGLMEMVEGEGVELVPVRQLQFLPPAAGWQVKQLRLSAAAR